MANYLFELEYKGQVYTIIDTTAQKSLKTKADLVNGKVPSSQLPYISYTAEELNALLAKKVNTSDLARVATTGQYEDLLGLPENLITQDILTQTLAQYEFSYNQLISLPTINGIQIKGNLTTEDLQITVDTIKSYNDLENKPKINGKELVGNLTTTDLGLSLSGESDPLYIADKPLLATKEYVDEAIKTLSTVQVSVGVPIAITHSNVQNNTISLDITNYPYACIGAVALTSGDISEFVPLYQETGITRIVKQTITSDNTTQVLLVLTLGSLFVGEWTGYIYLQQFVHGQQSETPDNPDTPDDPDTPDVSGGISVLDGTLTFAEGTGAEIDSESENTLVLTDTEKVTYSVQDETLIIEQLT